MSKYIDAETAWYIAEKTIKPRCTNCEFNFDGTCAGHSILDDGGDTYGMPITETRKRFRKGCNAYGLSFKAFSKAMKGYEILMI